jgi:hypothetical protein
MTEFRRNRHTGDLGFQGGTPSRRAFPFEVTEHVGMSCSILYVGSASVDCLGGATLCRMFAHDNRIRSLPGGAKAVLFEFPSWKSTLSRSLIFL